MLNTYESHGLMAENIKSKMLKLQQHINGTSCPIP